MTEAGDGAACARLVEAFLPAITGMAHRYDCSADVERGELIQEGVVGLLRAARRFDPAMGTPFWGYASWWVRRAMQQLVAEMTRPVILSDGALRELARLEETRREHVQAHGSEPAPSELATATGLPQAHVERLLAVQRTPRAPE